MSRHSKNTNSTFTNHTSYLTLCSYMKVPNTYLDYSSSLVINVDDYLEFRRHNHPLVVEKLFINKIKIPRKNEPW